MFKVTADFSGLEKLQRNMEKLDGEHSLTFSELFTPDFMKRFTDHETIDDMMDANGFAAATAEEFARIADAEWDEFVKATTRFDSWEEMQAKAAGEWTLRQLSR